MLRIFLLFELLQCSLAVPFHATIDDILTEIHNGKSCQEVTAEFLHRINSYDLKGPQLRAVSIMNPRITAQAKELDLYYITAGNIRGRLHCVPILVSDNIDVAGIPTAPGVGEISDSVPQVHSKIVELLTNAGAIVIGKTTVPPFGDEMRPSKGLTLNAFDIQSTPTGLETGLATGYAAFGIGTDTYGTLLQSAAAANLLAFRPTWTRLSNKGIMPDFYLQQTPAIVTRSAKDLAIAMDILDPVASAHKFMVYTSPRVLDQNSFTGLNIGIPDLFAFKKFEVLHPFRNRTVEYKISDEMKLKVVDKSLKSVHSLGGKIHNLTFTYEAIEPFMEEIGNLWFNLSSCKVSWMDTYFAESDRFPPNSPYHSFAEMIESRNIPKEIELGFKHHLENRHLCPAAAENFVEIRKMLTDTLFKPLFKRNDILLLPTSPDFSLRTPSNAFSPALLAAMLGYPCITLPTAFSQYSVDAPQGRPGGVLFMAQPTKMDLLVKVAFAYQTRFPERKVPWTVAAYGQEEVENCGLCVSVGREQLMCGIFVLFSVFWRIIS